MLIIKRNYTFMLIATTLLFTFNCGAKDYSSANKIGIKWELLNNGIRIKNGFEAKFTIKNKSEIKLTNSNWKLFFSIAPRPIIENEVAQPAVIQHINGDWFVMVPEKDFSLKPGDSIDISYRGIEAVIKESDAPSGLYFAFYDTNGKEKEIVQVSDFTLVPFTKPDQINRNAEDEEPIQTPEFRYGNNSDAVELDSSELKIIIPSPISIKAGKGNLTVNDEINIHYQKGLESEAKFLANKLESITGSSFRVTDTSSKDKAISLNLGNVKTEGVAEEAYSLNISPKGITITGNEAAGVFYGIQSLLALVPLDAYKTNAKSFEIKSVSITDAPRFGFRSIHVDVCRNFQTKETIKRILDVSAFYKVNHFLFYTTEDEGWRLEINDLPELTSVGGQREHTYGMEAPILHPAYGSGPTAYDKGKNGSGFYTRDDFIEILKYAKERHIKIIPELNFPGHARAAIKAMEARYERLMDEGKEEEANEYRLVDPDDKSEYLSAQSFKDNVVCVGRESVYRFYEKVVDEITSMYNEAGLTLEEMHAGGDEVAEGAWTNSPVINELLKSLPEVKDPKNLQNYFFRRLVKMLEEKNLRIDGWEEVALTKENDNVYVPNPEFVERDVVPFVWNNLWGSQDLGYRLANFGYNIVLCNVSNFYFDLAYNKDPKEPGLYWAGFCKTRNAWEFAPFDLFKTTYKTVMGRIIDQEKEYAEMERLKPEARDNILGVEAHLWSETIKGRDMIEYYMLPKLFGFVESAWSPERRWETIENKEERDNAIAEEWNIFANTIAHKDLPRLNYLNGGYNYRLPLPGAIIEDGMLKTNIEFPGLTLRYTTDGSEPDKNSELYEEPVKVSGTVKIKSFDSSGKSSRASIVTAE